MVVRTEYLLVSKQRLSRQRAPDKAYCPLWYADAVSVAAPPLHSDIMKRWCPKMRNTDSPVRHYEVKLTGRRRQQPYALKARRSR